MRPPEPLKYLAGSILIYYVMAACSAPAGTTSNPTNSAPGAASSSGATSGSGSSASTGSSSGGGTTTTGSSSGGGASSSSGSHSSSGSPVPDANADTSQSGSRLKAAYYVGTDGSKQFAEWQDSSRGNETCQFQTASDGAVRCLPTTSAYAESYYSDPSCSQPLAFTEAPCATAPRYASGYVASSCPTRVEIFSIVSVYTGTLYVGSSASCTATTGSATFTYYTVSSEISPSSFQSAQVQVD